MPITKNEVITAGEMLRPRFDHYGNTRFTLLVSRYDMDTVYVPVFCRMRLPENIKAHDNVLVKGSLISFRERIGEGQYNPVLEIDAESIEKREETVMERVFGKTGHVPDRPFFNAYLTGTIDYVSEAPREGRSSLFRRLQIQVDQDRRDRLPQYIPLQYFDDGRRLPRFDSFQLKRGDTINVWVTLATPTKVSAERGEQRFRDLNVEDLIVEKRAGNEEEAARAARLARRAEREQARRERRLEADAARALAETTNEFDEEFAPSQEEIAQREETVRQVVENRQADITEQSETESGAAVGAPEPVTDTAGIPADNAPVPGPDMTDTAASPVPTEKNGFDEAEEDDLDEAGDDEVPASSAENEEEARENAFSPKASSLFDEDWDADDDADENENDL